MRGSQLSRTQQVHRPAAAGPRPVDGQLDVAHHRPGPGPARLGMLGSRPAGPPGQPAGRAHRSGAAGRLCRGCEYRRATAVGAAGGLGRRPGCSAGPSIGPPSFLPRAIVCSTPLLPRSWLPDARPPLPLVRLPALPAPAVEPTAVASPTWHRPHVSVLRPERRPSGRAGTATQPRFRPRRPDAEPRGCGPRPGPTVRPWSFTAGRIA